MKKIFFLILSLGIFFSVKPATAMELVSSTLYTDLSSYWNLNTNANDSVSTVNGTATNITWTSVANSKFNGSAQFDGTNSYITLNNFFDSSNQSFSVVAWIYPSENDDPWERYVSYENSGNYGWWLGADGSAGTKFIFHMETGGKSIIDPSTFTLNTWYQLIGTYDGTTAKFYKNGTLIDSTTTGFTYDVSTKLVFGGLWEAGTQVSADDRLNGRLDDIGIFKGKVLSQSEITALYADWVPPTGGTTSTFSVSSTLFNTFYTNYKNSVIWIASVLLLFSCFAMIIRVMAKLKLYEN